MIVKALSLKEPWASRIRDGQKTIETRLWATAYRGPLLICASKDPPILLAGHAVALCRLVECRRMVPADEGAAGCSVYPGAWSWVLSKVQQITPFRVKGQQRLFDVELPSTVGNWCALGKVDDPAPPVVVAALRAAVAAFSEDTAEL